MGGKGNVIIFFLFFFSVVFYTNFLVQIYLLLWITGCFSSDELSKTAEQILTWNALYTWMPCMRKKEDWASGITAQLKQERKTQ